MSDSPPSTPRPFVRVTLKCTRIASGSISCALDAHGSVDELRDEIRPLLGVGISQGTPIRLIVAGHVMTEHETLASLHVVDGATIDVVVMTTTTTTTSSSPSSTTTTSSTTPSSRTPSYRDQMRQLASNPMMRALLSNPESLRAMLQMNPQMQRLMQTNPDVAAMLNSDSMLRQIADAALNPETLSQDRALQHIESMPGGGAALARAWQQVAEPMLDSLTPQVAEPDENLGELDESAPFPNAWSPNANAPPASSPFAVNPFLQPPASASPFGMSPAQSFAFLNSPMAQQMLSDPSFMQSLSNFQQQRPASLFAGGASPFGVRPAPVSNETLAARYSSQLALMDDMGFTDRVQNIDALRATNGDVDAAVERIAAALEAKEESATNTTTTTTSTTNSSSSDASRFERQLAQLAEMGLTDRERCLNALSLSNGNVEAALERLLRDA